MERGAILRPESDRGREDSRDLRDLARWQEVSAKKDSLGIGNCWRDLAYDRYQYHGVYVMDYAGNGVPPYSLNEDYSQGQWWTAQAEVSRTFLAKHHVTIGTEERFNTRQDQGNYDLPSHEFHLNDHRNSIVVAVYAQDQYKILPNLILSAGCLVNNFGRLKFVS